MATNGSADDCPEVEAETSFEVLLYIYDLSKELSKSFKKILKGKPLPGIWHTGLVAYGREYYFGSSGIESCRPGETILGEPDQILRLGKTELPYSVFLEYIFALGESSYRPGSYHLLEHNCNCFSQEVSNFLTGGPIPQEIRDLPTEISGNKNLSSALKEYFDKLSLRAEGSKGISFGSSTVVRISEEHRNGHAPESEQTNHKQQNGKSKKSKMPTTNGIQEQPQGGGATPKKNGAAPVSAKVNSNEEPEVPPEQVPQQNNNEDTNNASGDATGNQVASHNENHDQEEAPLPTFTSRRSRKFEDPPIIYTDIDGPGDLKTLIEKVESKISKEEKTCLQELMDYLTSDGGAWALGNPHLEAVSRLLNDRNMPSEIPVLTLRVLQAAALKEDAILLLHQDRKDHYVMSYLYKIESLSEEEQENIAAFMCNLCANNSSFDWLMYISEWEEEGHSCNNSKVTVRVAVNALLSPRPETQEKGSALVYNLALKELFDDTATELAMAIIQYLQADLNEEIAFRNLTALLRYMNISYNDVPALLKMLGPDVSKFNGKSERVDEVIDQIQIKLRTQP